MDENAISDLKQFIAATITQQTYDLREDITGLHEDITGLHEGISRLDAKIDGVDRKLSAKIDDLSASVAEAIDSQDGATGSKLTDHEHRIARLEAKTA